MRPELDVLVPLHLFAAVCRLEVQLRMVELHVGTEQVDGDVDDGRLRRERPVRVVQISGRAEPAQSGLVGGVSGVEVEDDVRLGQRATLLDELVGDRAQPLEPDIVDEPGNRAPTVLVVVRRAGRRTARAKGSRDDRGELRRRIPGLDAQPATGGLSVQSVGAMRRGVRGVSRRRSRGGASRSRAGRASRRRG